MLLAAALLWSGQGYSAADVSVDFEQISHREMARRMSDCGLTSVDIGYQDELQSDVVSIADPEISSDKLRCIAEKSWKTFYIVEFAEPYWLQYAEITNELWNPIMVSQARLHFSERPELGPPPERREGESDPELAKRIQTFCGPKATGAFTFEYGGSAAISPDWATDLDIANPDSVEMFSCLTNAALLAGLRFGLIGNGEFLE